MRSKFLIIFIESAERYPAQKLILSELSWAWASSSLTHVTSDKDILIKIVLSKTINFQVYNNYGKYNITRLLQPDVPGLRL